MRTSLIQHVSNAKMVIIREDYLMLCTYLAGEKIVQNHCAAALMNEYEYLVNSTKGSKSPKKAEGLWQELNIVELMESLLDTYSEKTIRAANAYLEEKGFIKIKRSKISGKKNAKNQILFNVEKVNECLDVLQKQQMKYVDESEISYVNLRNKKMRLLRKNAQQNTDLVTHFYAQYKDKIVINDLEEKEKKEEKPLSFSEKTNNENPVTPTADNRYSIEHKKESNPPSSARPPSLKNSKGENTKVVLAHFDALAKKLDVSYVYPKTAAMWNPIHACCSQIYNEVGAEGLSEFFSKVESMFASEAFPFKDKTSITPVFIGSAKVLGMIANYIQQPTNSHETVQLSVLTNSGLKTLKIARKCKAYEIAERLVDKQTGFILNEGISQEDKNHIAWITKNIVNHINQNTAEKQEWFCEFVTRKI